MVCRYALPFLNNLNNKKYIKYKGCREKLLNMYLYQMARKRYFFQKVSILEVFHIKWSKGKLIAIYKRKYSTTIRK